MPTNGTQGQPQFATSDSVAIASYLTSIANYAALVGNYKVGTTAQRTAATETAKTAWDGLLWRDTTLHAFYLRLGGGWSLLLTDQGWNLSNLSLAGGWSTKTDSNGGTADGGVGGVRRINQTVYLRFRATRSGGTITADSQGNIADTALAALPTNLAPAGTEYGSVFMPGTGQGSVRIQTDGQIVLTDLYPTDAITNGGIVQVSAVYPLG